ncbi:hypothetical protein Ab1vBOLIVR5_gp24 [Agrobacterium phage OLIVR5]|uniref:Uncharacterized protein n=1 Tax=Agrobacterium phage OLIVR5 TaxID=2723773 RepID=A0A858MSE7_9CAUD|nr:hypothetical protein KNU99_gp024 [Agrobacterium phage OLIVR5]QIW87672.1 hypothetical protein Ab1vBOLIVR5_gp24 [Agrobacterium phage OLIVR5]QIW87931.1 hypothetical protein Ab1vBOLIVR6_gp24 [Agrobacterium phage OLIVR6]
MSISNPTSNQTSSFTETSKWLLSFLRTSSTILTF